MSNQNKYLKNILKYLNTLFDRSLDTYKYNTMSLEVDPNTNLRYYKPYSISLKYYNRAKEEFDRLEKLDIIEQDYNTKPTAPCFI